MARRRRLGEVLVTDGIITELDLARALEAQSAGIGPRRRLGATLVELGIVDEQELATALAHQLGLEMVDLRRRAPDLSATNTIGPELARRHLVVPMELESDGTLVVAMVDPTNIVALDELRMATRAPRVRPLVATESALAAALDRHYPAAGSLADMDEYQARFESYEGAEDEGTDDPLDEGDIDSKPIVKLANTLIVDAMRLRASDIHVEPTRGDVRIRFRVDGILTEVMRVPRPARAPLISRLKLMGGMDISERRRPQDGRTAMTVHGQPVDVRMSAMPTMHGEKVVMRLLRRGGEQIAMDELGLESDIEEAMREVIESPQGILLVTGPTGSGKTTTVYAALAEMATVTRNVITLEDPIEYELELINQTQVNPRIGFTFAVGMRTVLRQDPDVLMVGEIRDLETAELAFEAAMTGHLMLSTVHTNNAAATILRMAELGVERHLIGSSLSLILAQRLVRVVCRECAVDDTDLPSERVMRRLGLEPESLEGAKMRRGPGCNVCAETGFMGRQSVVEALVLSSTIRDLITSGATESKLREQARAEGMRSMRHDGIVKVMRGITTFDEVLRATPDDPRLDTNALVRHLVEGGDGRQNFLVERRAARRDLMEGLAEADEDHARRRVFDVVTDEDGVSDDEHSEGSASDWAS